jgi:hypothetical protein
MTISRLLEDLKAQAALHGRVLVVDEADTFLRGLTKAKL